LHLDDPALTTQTEMMMASVLDLARMNDSGDLAGGISELAFTAGDDAMVVTAVRTTGGTLRLITWRANAAGPVTRLGDSADDGGAGSDIDIARGDRFVVACREAGGHVQLSSWTIDDTGSTIVRTGDSGMQAGGATLLRLVALTGTVFVVACRLAEGTLRLISWQMNADGSFARLADSADAGGRADEIALCRLAEDRVLTAVRDEHGHLRAIVWAVAADGTFTRLSDSAEAAGAATLIRAVVNESGMVLTSFRNEAGNLRVISWDVAGDGTISRRHDSGNQAFGIVENALIALADGVVSAVRIGEGNLRLIGWTVDVDGTIARRGDSALQASTATHIEIIAGT